MQSLLYETTQVYSSINRIRSPLTVIPINVGSGSTRVKYT